MNGVPMAKLAERVTGLGRLLVGLRFLEKREVFPIGCRYHSLIPKGVAGIVLHERRVEKSSFSQRASSDD
ncbi:hypothetical protein TYRP_021614 [Tyrophagus putrescentiae]|nr:hypothetical protein TYRP_021614 [Tyrophagus putrescentiae]